MNFQLHFKERKRQCEFMLKQKWLKNELGSLQNVNFKVSPLKEDDFLPPSLLEK